MWRMIKNKYYLPAPKQCPPSKHTCESTTGSGGLQLWSPWPGVAGPKTTAPKHQQLPREFDVPSRPPPSRCPEGSSPRAPQEAEGSLLDLSPGRTGSGCGLPQGTPHTWPPPPAVCATVMPTRPPLGKQPAASSCLLLVSSESPEE